MQGSCPSARFQLIPSGTGGETMNKTVFKPMPKRSKVGEVVTLAEKMQQARELSSCCVGTEALLESGFDREYPAPRKQAGPDAKKHR